MADPSSGSTRPSLLLRIRDPQDAASWQVFVEVYAPLVYGHCRRRGLRHEDAEDVSQNVFTQVSRAIQNFRYRPDVGRFRDWLGTVVRNEVTRFFGRKSRAALDRSDPDETAALDQLAARPEDTAWEEDFKAHVFQTALARSRPHFKDDTWRAFELVWLENRPAADVAAQLGHTLDWVYVAKSRVLKQLWHEVQELADDTTLFSPQE